MGEGVKEMVMTIMTFPHPKRRMMDQSERNIKTLMATINDQLLEESQLRLRVKVDQLMESAVPPIAYCDCGPEACISSIPRENIYFECRPEQTRNNMEAFRWARNNGFEVPRNNGFEVP